MSRSYDLIMCACGCFLALAVIAGLVYCFVHALWLPAALIVILAAVLSWLGGKAARGRPK